MSKPNLLGFATSVGFFRNQKVRELRSKLLKNVQRTVQFGDVAPMLFQSLMAYAAENQIDGDFSSYDSERFSEIFQNNNIPVSVNEAALVQKAFEEVGLTEGGKIRSWTKFNRHLGEYEKIVKAKRKAAQIMHKKRQQDLKASAAPVPAAERNGNGHSPAPSAPAPEKARAKEASPTARVISLKKLMENHAGKPNAANAPNDRDTLKYAKSEYRVFEAELARLNAEIAGVRA